MDYNYLGTYTRKDLEDGRLKKCYRVYKDEYISDELYEDKEHIWIIAESDEMVFRNRVIGSYDGRTVVDYNEDDWEVYYPSRKEVIVSTGYSGYWTTQDVRPKVSEEQRDELTIEVCPDFSQYSNVVDEFFKGYK